ncbi:toxin [Pseudomonas mandelii]|uniref:RHS repeat-associated core domain-containing protein n=1 Tax=Pseudomonas mandelii TaxID=75612 RepID=UPI001C82F041|nr:RHS repeat-associated core domain-containing protein [Pseudomonas mandelii]QZA96917.1 toxin [Pseudomonas mandelii]
MSQNLHYRTASVIAHESRELPARQIAYLRKRPGDALEPLITRQRHDVIGQLVEQRDPRLVDALTPNLANVHGLSGQLLKISSVDAGWRISLPGLAGEILQRWDAQGSHWRTVYDDQLRVLAVDENDQPNVETFRYADATADKAFNLCGQLVRQVDPSGTLEWLSFGLHGQALRDSRTITGAGAFPGSRTYSPLGTLLTQTDAGDHQQRMVYDRAGQLQQVHLRLAPTEAWLPVLEDARYNAAGQIIEQHAGNQVLSTWAYDDADGRLTTLKAGVPGQGLLQHFQYEYDRVGNVLRIDDLAFKPVYFANQLIDGHREFSYNALYQLTRATGHDAAPSTGLPGRPSPTDPAHHLNYTQHYEYDDGGNLITLIHERAVGNYTHEMFIDPTSNRGVRWKQGDPEPVFDTLFDRHGNLLASAPGRPLAWNSRDQLARATLVERDDGRHDDEVFRYSQGERVFKRHEWQAATLTHFHQVLYLPGLEIRTRDNGEELHVITLPGGRGSVRCLHWVSNKPDAIAQNQLRYSLDDDLGSCLMELDQNVRLISHEGYYPLGGTAWLTAASLLEVGYKTIRYSGKEMDECGLYYYGARYYAPWLQRWVNPDPAWSVDGLNLYAFVTNNPMRYRDNGGTHKEESAEQQIIDTSNTLSTVNSEMQKLNYQLYNLTRTRDIYKTAAKKLLYSVASFAVTFHSGAAGAAVGSGVGSLTGPAAPVAVPVAAAVGGIFAAEAAAKFMDKLGDETGLGYTITPDPSGFSVSNIKSKSRAEPFSVQAVAQSFSPKNSAGLTKTAIETTARVIGKHLKVPYLKQTLAIARQATQLTEALNDSLGQGDLDKISANLDALDAYLNDVEAQANEALETLADAAVYDDRLIGAVNMPMNSGAVDRSRLEQQFKVARSGIKHARNLVGRVSQYLAEKRAA